MHSRREAAGKILGTFLYAFRAKREKKVMHFLNILCSFGQTLKQTLLLSDRCRSGETVRIYRGHRRGKLLVLFLFIPMPGTSARSDRIRRDPQQAFDSDGFRWFGALSLEVLVDENNWARLQSVAFEQTRA